MLTDSRERGRERQTDREHRWEKHQPGTEPATSGIWSGMTLQPAATGQGGRSEIVLPSQLKQSLGPFATARLWKGNTGTGILLMCGRRKCQPATGCKPAEFLPDRLVLPLVTLRMLAALRCCLKPKQVPLYT